MRIVFLSIVDPAGGPGGAWTVTQSLLGMLADLYPTATIDVLPLPEWSGFARRWRQGLSVVRGLTGPLPAKVAYAVDASLRAGLGTADLAIINGSDLLWIMPYLRQGTPTVLLSHNLEHQLFAQQAGWLGILARGEIARFRRFELDGMSRAGQVIFLSTEEQQWALRELPDLRTVVLPPIFLYPGNRTRPAINGTFDILLVSNLRWWPNAEGLKWFLRHVWPEAPPNMRLQLCGPGSAEAARGLPRVTGHGVVEDLNPLWARSHALIAPILKGAGVRVKMAEALYNRLPVLSTPAAAKGLASTEGVRVLDGPAEWIAFLRSNEFENWVSRPIPEAVPRSYSRENGMALLGEFLPGVTVEARESADYGTRHRRHGA